MSSANDTALLSVSDGFTLFAYGDHRIRFKTPARLKRYLAVKQWDAGYLVADAEYDGVADPVEEYVDLVPILENLYVDDGRFLAPIKRVEVDDGNC